MRRIFLPILLLCLSAQAGAGDQTLVTYNLLNYSSTSGSRVPYFRTIVGEIAPDLIVCQELLSYSGRNHFFINVLEVVEPGAWTAAPFHDGYDTDSGLFYKPAVFEVLDSGWLDTTLRDIDWWHLREIESGIEFRLFTLHLKASQGEDNEAQRLAEATILRNYINSLSAGLPVIVAGDYNIYNSYEPAYQLLMSPGEARLFDPINRPGYWHNNSSFADIHTQSTRTESFDGGASGGLDDRFDLILVNDELVDGDGVEILPETYAAFGNDGQHFNQSINYGTNSAVSPEVADALYEASDHLPVVAALRFPTSTAVDPLPAVAVRLEAWPNPFNPVVSLRVADSAARSDGSGVFDLAVFDLTGRRVAQLWQGRAPTAGEVVRWQPQGLASGVYIARLSAAGRTIAMEKLVLLK